MAQDHVSRKEFLQKCLSIACISGSLISTLAKTGTVVNAQTAKSSLIAVKGGMPDAMFDAGIKELGGSLSSIISKGQTVVVKPNIGWDKEPEDAANTNPLLVKRVVEHCYNAGAKKVYVFDNSCNYWKSSYKNSGIEKAAKEAKATVAPAHSESYYQSVEIRKGKTLKKSKVHELILSSDVFINVPVLKHHSGAGMTAAMKNLMGIVWDRYAYHSADLHQCIADFCTYRAPDLNIIDAYSVMMKNGPRGIRRSDLALKKMLLISKDVVAIDSAASKILGKDPDSIRHIRVGESMGLGHADLEKVAIKRITI